MNKEKKLSFIEGAWVFFTGCILGFIIETIFCTVKYGHYINKQGLLIGPFKPIYGIAALLITIAFYILKNQKTINVFIIGTIIGSVFEYIASLFLEVVFKSFIWNYSGFKYNINGRIYLPYCILWGLIAVLWVKIIYPRIKKLYNKLESKKYFNLVSYIMIVFMFFNVLLTFIVLLRHTCFANTKGVFKIIDRFYPKAKLKQIFPKLRPIK